MHSEVKAIAKETVRSKFEEQLAVTLVSPTPASPSLLPVDNEHARSYGVSLARLVPWMKICASQNPLWETMGQAAGGRCTMGTRLPPTPHTVGPTVRPLHFHTVDPTVSAGTMAHGPYGDVVLRAIHKIEETKESGCTLSDQGEVEERKEGRLQRS
jgi:hypothetical protein